MGWWIRSMVCSILCAIAAGRSRRKKVEDAAASRSCCWSNTGSTQSAAAATVTTITCTAIATDYEPGALPPGLTGPELLQRMVGGRGKGASSIVLRWGRP